MVEGVACLHCLGHELLARHEIRQGPFVEIVDQEVEDVAHALTLSLHER
jgi:hypothetical protein